MTRWAAKALRAPLSLVSLADADGQVATSVGGARSAGDADGIRALCARVVATSAVQAIDDIDLRDAIVTAIGTSPSSARR